MKSIYIVTLLILASCTYSGPKEISSVNPINWKKRMIEQMPTDSLISGSTYLSVYSQIYSENEKRILNLTATVSLRNTNRNDTIYIDKAEYFDTKGNLIRTYFSETIFIAPMETVEIIIDQHDMDGGTGANFLFDWKAKPDSNEPFFEAVMISTYSQQGLSFSTQGQKLK